MTTKKRIAQMPGEVEGLLRSHGMLPATVETQGTSYVTWAAAQMPADVDVPREPQPSPRVIFCAGAHHEACPECVKAGRCALATSGVEGRKP